MAVNVTSQLYHISLINSVSYSSQFLFQFLLYTSEIPVISLILSNDLALYFPKKIKDIIQEPLKLVCIKHLYLLYFNLIYLVVLFQ